MAVTALQPQKARSTRGGAGIYAGAGAPSNGTTNVQTITQTGSPGGGTYKLSFRNVATAAIAQNAASSAVQTALRALSTIGSTGCSVSGSAGGPYTVTFSGALAQQNLPLLVLFSNSLTGGTNPSVTIANGTPGVDATGYGAAAGAVYVDTTNNDAYQNVGTTTAPSWVQFGQRIAKVALAAVDTGGGIFAWQNPEARDIAVLRVLIDVKTVASGACTIAVGTTATNATTSSNNLLDALDVHTAAGLFDNFGTPGAAGKFIQRLAAGKWVTGSKASGASAALVGFAYIFYTPLS